MLKYSTITSPRNRNHFFLHAGSIGRPRPSSWRRGRLLDLRILERRRIDRLSQRSSFLEIRTTFKIERGTMSKRLRMRQVVFLHPHRRCRSRRTSRRLTVENHLQRR